MSIIVPLSFTAIRVPPIQFQLQAGVPLRLVNTDMLSGCGGMSLANALLPIMNLINSGLAFNISSVMSQINSMINSVLGPINNFISNTVGSINSDLQGMLSSITGSAMSTIQATVSNMATSVVSAAGTISAMTNLASTMGLSLPSISSIFSSISGGQINAAL